MTSPAPNPMQYLRGVGAIARGGVGGLGGIAGANAGALSGAASGASSLAEQFATLLERARSGQAQSGLAVTVSPRVKIDLSSEQLARLSQAADRAEAAGLTRAVALLDGRAFILEVQTRSISAEIAPGSAALHGIDGVLSVPPAAPSATGGPADPAVASAGAGTSIALPGAALRVPSADLPAPDALRTLLARAQRAAG